jgi:dienelactone hydrolase
MEVNVTAVVREAIRSFLNLELALEAPDFEVLESGAFGNYTRRLITFVAADGDRIPAYLFRPDGRGPFPAVLIHHQHHSQRHLGKSEPAGLAGDPRQAFAPALAERGFAALVPDSLCFEDRRRNAAGIDAHEDDDIQHYLEMGERLTLSDTLMRKVLADASSGLALLAGLPEVDKRRIGVLGHSYGGNTTLFQAALDERVSFAAASGALCSYAHKRAKNIPLELALIIPGFAARWDMDDLLDCIAPRELLVVSAVEDVYSQDAERVIERAADSAHIKHFRDQGGHALTAERFDLIVDHLVSCAR